ncbi:MAG: molybdopterin molybdotransferase MoeA [Bacteroidia bacterium]
MISVEKARTLILKNTRALRVLKHPVTDAQGCVLAENIKAPVHLPPFNQSAMDGYAVICTDVKNKKKIKVVGEVAAGKVFNCKMKSGEAVRIFTGAPVPEGADAVIMQEKVTFQNGYLIAGEIPLKFKNIRKKGSQIKQGKTAMYKGTVLTPGSVGYLTAMGIASVNIFPAPRITVIVTGSELKKPGTKLKVGQIYESNSYALQAALHSIGIDNAEIISIPDDEKTTQQTLKRALKHSDMILLTGGISVGDYDYVGKALQQQRVTNIFYKIKTKAR